MSQQRLSTTTLFGTDYQQSVLRIVTAASHSVRAYTAYGSEAFTADIAGRPGFNGEVLDGSTRNYMSGNGYRAYSPAMMRFCRPDDQSPFGRGGLNAYGYCLADPINLRDPDGHIPLPNFLRRPLARLRTVVARTYERRPALMDGPTWRGADPAKKSPGGPSTGWMHEGAHVQDPLRAIRLRDGVTQLANAPELTDFQIAAQREHESAIRRMKAAEQASKDPVPMYHKVASHRADDLPNYKQAKAAADLYELPWEQADIRKSS